MEKEMGITQRLWAGAALLTLAVTISFAQGPRAGNGPGAGQGYGVGQPAIDVAKQEVIEGVVTAVNIGFGAQYPSIEINKKQIKIAPVWFLLENDFELKEKDQVRVIAAPSTATADAYLHALSIRNLLTGGEIKLRDDYGVPLWVRGRGRGANPGGQGYGVMTGGCIDPATIKEITGTVDKVTMGAGIRQPTLIIKTGSGEIVTVRIGPERVLLEADFELNPGEQVKARVATASCSNELVALQLTNQAGQTVKLRNDDGSRAW